MRTLIILASALLVALSAVAQDTGGQSIASSPPNDSIAFVALTEPQKEFIANMLRGAKEWARLQAGVDLNGSEETVANLEAVLASTVSWLKTPGLDLVQQRTEGTCMAYGVYLGQIFVDQLQAEWGTTRTNSESSSELAVRTKGARHILIYPIRRVCSRITEGPQYNVIDYYNSAVSAAQKAQ